MSETDDLKWLINRSDTLRSSYAGRAALVLTADTLVLGIVFIVLDKDGIKPSVALLIALIACFVFALGSLIFSFLGVGTVVRSSRVVTRSDASDRAFLAPRETFATKDTPYRNRDQSFARFKELFGELHASGFREQLLAELHVDLLLQHVRYRNVKVAIWLLLGAVICLAVAFALVARQWYGGA